MRRFLLAMSALAVTTAAVMACGVGTDCDFGLCAGPPVGTNEGGDGSISQIDATAPGCDPTKDQKDQEACLNDDFGVFVSLTGKPDGTGTKASPVNAVARAFELAKGTKQRIFVCEGSYEERIALKAPVSIYGGLSCTGGAWKKGESAVFKNLQQPGYALDIVRVAGLFEIVNLEFAAAPGTTITRSSIAARVVSSPGLSLKRVALTASDGSSGDPGAGGKTGDRVPATAKGSPGTAGAGGGAERLHLFNRWTDGWRRGRWTSKRRRLAWHGRRNAERSD